MRKLKLKEVKQFAQSPMAREQRSWEWNALSSASKAPSYRKLKNLMRRALQKGGEIA